jgi:hypothetical protein
MKKTREYTSKLLEMMDEGLIDPAQLAQNLMGWMPERDVERFFKSEYASDFEMYEEDVA